MNPPLLTIGMLHYRKLDSLRRAVSALRTHTRHPYRLHIVNQGFEGDGIRAYLDELAEDPRNCIRRLPDNIGCSRGRRLLAEASDTAITVMLDDDICVGPDWDVPVAARLSADGGPEAVGFHLYHPDGRYWVVGGWRIRQCGRVVHFDRPPAGTDGAVDGVCGGAMAFRTELRRVHAWDPAYFIGFEDMDMALDMKRRGTRCEILPSSRLVHEKISTAHGARAYHAVRRDYRMIREAYLHFACKHDCRLDWPRDFFYRSLCRLPPGWVRPLALLWLRAHRIP